MARMRIGQLAIVAGMTLALAGCEDGDFKLFQPKDKGAAAATGTTSQRAAGATVERDVEAPEVFEATSMGLWDGRPSLGGVWVAHPDVTDPERVTIRNKANGKFVIGALFRRERENPGPPFQVSSDAAEELGMLAGQPVELNVIALRKEEVPQELPKPAEEQVDDLAAPEEIEQQTLDPIASAAAAIDKADGTAPEPVIQPAGTAPTTAAAAPAPAAPAKASSLSKPFIQIGIFSVEENANNTAIALRKAGVVPTVRKQSSKGKTFWRVIVGPATTSSDRAAVLKTVKGLGFNDAYFVTN